MSEPKDWEPPAHQPTAGLHDADMQRQQEPPPFIPGLVAGGLEVPVKILIPIMAIVGAITLAILGFFLPLLLDPARPSDLTQVTADVQLTALLGLAALTFLLAVLALALRRIRGWLGLAALATCVTGFALALPWLGFS